MSQKGQKERMFELQEKEWKSEGYHDEKDEKEGREKRQGRIGKEKRTIKTKENYEDNQQDNGPSMNGKDSEPCRTKFEHLLPRYLSSKLTKSHIDLLNFSDKIDSYLIVSQEKTKSKFIFLSQIVRYFKKQYSSNQIINSFRQILYLDNTFYSYQLCSSEEYFDIKIDANLEKVQKISRRIQLRKLIFDFSMKNGNKTILLNCIDDNDEINESFQRQKDIIPMVTLEVNSRSLVENNQQFQDNFHPLQLASPSIPFQRPVNLKLLSFRQHLYSKLSSKQQQIHSNNYPSSSVIPKKYFLRIIDQIHSTYYTRRVRSIFLIILIQYIFKRTSYNKLLISQTIKQIINSSQYLEQIHSAGGIIIHVNMKIYKQYRQSISSST